MLYQVLSSRSRSLSLHVCLCPSLVRIVNVYVENVTHFSFGLIKTYYFDWLLFKFGGQIIMIPKLALSNFPSCDLCLHVMRLRRKQLNAKWIDENQPCTHNSTQPHHHQRNGVCIDGRMNDNLCVYQTGVLKKERDRHPKRMPKMLIRTCTHTHTCVMLTSSSPSLSLNDRSIVLHIKRCFFCWSKTRKPLINDQMLVSNIRFFLLHKNWTHKLIHSNYHLNHMLRIYCAVAVSTSFLSLSFSFLPCTSVHCPSGLLVWAIKIHFICYVCVVRGCMHTEIYWSVFNFWTYLVCFLFFKNKIK